MPVVTAPTALTDVSVASSSAGPTLNEQNLDATNGNSFTNSWGTVLFVRNTTVAAIILDFYSDLNGLECLIQSTSIPGSGTVNGEKIVGPFPPRLFSDHSTTVSAGTSQGKVFLKQRTGSAGDIKVSPLPINQSLAA